MKEFEGHESHYQNALKLVSAEELVKRAKFILTHHTPITENILPFGMLSKEKQEELKIANNENANYSPSNIQFYSVSNKDWINENPSWHKCVIYRLDPTYKPKKKRLMTLEEIWDKRKEWEFDNGYAIVRIAKKVFNDSDEIERLWYSEVGSVSSCSIDKLKYRPIGSSEEFKPLPEMECEG